ncbi:hypothetical protein [Nonomuraea fuscirosea]|uniref:hypothetical protein n=1 Tax=Nonomuraea fuscirosea TaxID=1291556 RepID=UPI00342926B7
MPNATPHPLQGRHGARHHPGPRLPSSFPGRKLSRSLTTALLAFALTPLLTAPATATPSSDSVTHPANPTEAGALATSRTFGKTSAFSVASPDLPAAGASSFGPGTAQAQAAPAGRVVIVGVPGLEWSDLDEARTPNLWRLVAQGASASLSTRAVPPPDRGITCPTAGWLTVSAGQRAGTASKGCPEPPQPEPTPQGGATVPGWSALVAHQAETGYNAQLGTLGQLVTDGGGKVAAVGPGAALAAADKSGNIAKYAPTPAALGDPTPYNLIVLEAADLADAWAKQPLDEYGVPVSLTPAARQEATKRADQQIGALLGRLPTDTTVLVAGVSDVTPNAHLHVAIATGPSPDGRPYPHGFLTATSTRQDGLVAITDLTATAIDVLDLPAQRAVVGRPWRPGGTAPATPSGTVTELADEDLASQVLREVRGPFFAVFVTIQLLFYAFAALALRRRRTTTHRTAPSAPTHASSPPVQETDASPAAAVPTSEPTRQTQPAHTPDVTTSSRSQVPAAGTPDAAAAGERTSRETGLPSSAEPGVAATNGGRLPSSDEPGRRPTNDLGTRTAAEPGDRATYGSSVPPVDEAGVRVADDSDARISRTEGETDDPAARAGDDADDAVARAGDGVDASAGDLEEGGRPQASTSKLLVSVQIVAVVSGAIAVSTFLAQLVPWWSLPVPMVSVIVTILAIAGLITAAAFAGPWRADVLGPLTVVSAVTSVALLLDVMTGSKLQVNAVSGYEPVTGGRFYGFSNIAFAIYATGTVLGLAGVAQWLLRRGLPRVVVVVLCGLYGGFAVFADGWPSWGADFGGVPAFVIGLAVFLILLSGKRVSLLRLALVGLAGVALVGALSVFDWLRPDSERTHLGTFVQQVIDGEAWTVVGRKFGAMIGVTVGNWSLTLLSLVALAFLFLVLARPSRWGASALGQAYRLAPTLRAGLFGALTCAFVGFLMNDSGIAIPAMALTVAVPLTLAACVRALQLSKPTPPAPRSERAEPRRAEA